MRRPHTKSRFGCKQCKTRRVKCDEIRPSCTRCTQSARQCIYLTTTAPTSCPSPPHPSRSPSTVDPLDLSPSRRNSPPAKSLHPEGSPLDERYALSHLALLHHFETEVKTVTCAAVPEMEAVLDLALEEAFTTPYLMDEILAFSAAHKSTVDGRSRDALRREALRLQNRALASFNSERVEVCDQNCVAVFMFSTLLGHHVVFDVFSARDELAGMLDRLVGCLKLHRGFRVIASESWPWIRAKLQACVALHRRGSPRTTSPISETFGGACERLLGRLASSEIDDVTMRAYREAIKALQSALDDRHLIAPSSSRYYVAVQDWLVRVPVEYVTLVEQRRPEALVVLAHYAVILHCARGYWSVGGESGRRLVGLISGYLGVYWDEWVEWPKGVVGLGES